MGGGGGKGGGRNIPAPPNINKTLTKGAKFEQTYAPQAASLEQSLQNQYNPQRVAAQQALQAQYGPTQYNQQLAAFKQLDPGYVAARADLGNKLVQDVNAGSSLTPGQYNELSQNVLNQQASRGNVYSPAAGVESAYTIGDRGLQLQQQRYGNLAGFLGQPTMASQVGQVSPVTANTNYSYSDPNAPFEMLNAQNQRYAAQASAAAASSGGNSGASWGSTIGGVLGGVVGTIYGGPGGGQLGYAAGSGVGGGIGSLFSDKRLKTGVKRIGSVGPHGVGLYKFAMKGNGQKHIGLIAQNVEKHAPHAVMTDPQTGMKAVDYMSAAGMPGPLKVRS